MKVEAEIKDIWVFVRVNEPQCMGQYYGEDDYEHIDYFFSKDDLIEFIADFLAFEREGWRERQHIYHIKALVYNNEIYSRVISGKIYDNGFHCGYLKDDFENKHKFIESRELSDNERIKIKDEAAESRFYPEALQRKKEADRKKKEREDREKRQKKLEAHKKEKALYEKLKEKYEKVE